MQQNSTLKKIENANFFQSTAYRIQIVLNYTMFILINTMLKANKTPSRFSHVGSKFSILMNWNCLKFKTEVSKHILSMN